MYYLLNDDLIPEERGQAYTFDKTIQTILPLHLAMEAATLADRAHRNHSVKSADLTPSTPAI